MNMDIQQMLNLTITQLHGVNLALKAADPADIDSRILEEFSNIIECSAAICNDILNNEKSSLKLN